MPLKRLYRLQRARLTAAPLSLRPQASWRMRCVRGVLLASLGTALCVGGYLYGQQQLQQQMAAQSSSQQARGQQAQQQIASLLNEKALQAQQLTIVLAERDALLAAQKQQQQELSATRETLSFFESLLQSNDRSRLASFVACELQPLEAGKYRYRLLLVQGMNRTDELLGRLQVSLQYQHEGKKGRISQGQSSPIKVQARHYAKLEGELEPPEGASNLLLDVQFFGEQGNQVQASCQKKI
ncbi:DUF6776 family protein [Chitinibacter tainanensis]|uniref:DUF6776 family protein n=1 Tax=Chitinibacter tainanensis TaxID=230667 RepID=UPI000422D6B6|nr:DUF6776 family protein [Chitinibacter tainanensis]